MKAPLAKTIAAALTATALLCGTLNASPLKNSVRPNDLSVGMMVGANSFGMRISPSGSLLFRDHFVLGAGPVFASGTYKYTGFIIDSRYILVQERKSNSGHCRLSVGFSLERFNNAGLASGAQTIERMTADAMHNDEQSDFGALRFSGWEYSSGFAFSYHFGCRLLLRAEAMLSYYNTKQMNAFDIHPFREGNGFGFKTGVSIGWTMRRHTGA